MPSLFAVLLAILLPAAPVPKDQKSRYYTATKVGDKREFSVDGKVVLTEVVTKVEEAKGGGLLVTESVLKKDQTLRPVVTLLVTEDAVAAKEYHTIPYTYDPMRVVLKPKANVGDKWEWEVQLPGVQPRPQAPRLTNVYTARGIEKVEVPAGTFEAHRVDVSDASGTRTTWYAPGIGVVKEVRNPGMFKGVVRVLHAFTPGKGDGSLPYPMTPAKN